MTETEMTERRRRLIRMAESIVEAPERIGMLPLKERTAVALILNKTELFPMGEFTILQAVEYLGDDWLQVAIQAEKATMMIMD